MMAQEWYLLKPPHSQLSGFEDDALNDFATDGFAEALESGIGVDVELCNYDLTVRTPIRAIIENTVQDTKLKTLNRELFVPIGTCKAGMYIYYKCRYWLIVGLVDDNGMYEKAVMTICNYRLSWVNRDKKVVSRWANITSASQYNNGETFVRYYTLRTDQLMILTPDDPECLLIDSEQRFIIDRRCSVYETEFADDIVCDTSRPVITYKMTRSDSVLYNYTDSGHCEYIFTQDEQHEKDGYYVIDGQGYWLCEPASDTDKPAGMTAEIVTDSLVIYNGLEPGVFTAKFTDADGRVTEDVEPQWSIDCDFADELDVEYADHAILISADNRRLLNRMFVLTLTADGYSAVSVTVAIRAFF